MQKALKTVSLISYSFIILKGFMIGIPFLFWLMFTCFDFGSIYQFFAVVGSVGFVLNFTKYWETRIFKVLSFVLMVFPISRLLMSISIKEFDYLAFQIPLLIFIITYLILIIIPDRKLSTK